MNSNNRIITLTTDFGTADGYTGVVKGVILSIAPSVHIVDITHAVEAWDITGAAWIIANSYKFFPPLTVHLAVVDPGVGSEQRGIIITSDNGFFVGPDNGLFSFVLEDEGVKEAHIISNRAYMRETISSTFHARDVYGPVAAHIAAGESIAKIGKKVELLELSRLSKPKLEISKERVKGEVVYIDRYGNLITNIPASFADVLPLCTLDNKIRVTVSTTYSSAAKGCAAAFAGSHGYLEIAVNQGRAADIMQIHRQTPVTLEKGN